MPISRSQFDKAIDKLSEKVLKFLESHPDEAFAIEELAEGVGGRQLEVWSVLEELKQQKLAKGKCIEGKSHYCIGKA
jgi:hypothetical protein